MANQVYILTWCNRAEYLYGTTLTFKTLRVGFPTAKIHVIDNASLPECRPAIKQAAADCDAEFTQIEQEIEHHDFIESILNTQTNGNAVFVDPDICFWENVEGWNFDALMAGRYIPKFACEYSGCTTHPRLHTSFLWISDVCALQDTIRKLRSQFFEYEPFKPMMFLLDSTWHRYDTGASLYSTCSQKIHCFTVNELNAYDHLFCGTHLEEVVHSIHDNYASIFKKLHKEVQINHLSLKGAWKIQEDYFHSRAI